MRIIIILIIIPLLSFGQVANTPLGKLYLWGDGPPSFTPSRSPSLYIDRTNDRVYKWLTWQGWVNETNQGVVDFCLNKTKERNFINDYLLEDFGEITVKGTNSLQTLLSSGVSSSVFSGITVSQSDYLDWANLQYAIYLSRITKKPVNLYGDFDGINKAIVINKDHYWLVVNGNYAKLSTTGGGTFAVFSRVKPLNHAEASPMVSETEWDIRDLIMHCQNTQTGFYTGPMADARFSNITIYNAAVGFDCRFILNTVFNQITAVLCDSSFVVDAGDYNDVGTASRATTTTTFNKCHVYAIDATVGFIIYNSEKINFRDVIIEGGTIHRGIDIQGFGNGNFREVHIDGLYYEANLSPAFSQTPEYQMSVSKMQRYLEKAGQLHPNDQRPYKDYSSRPVGNGDAAVYVRFGSGIIHINSIKGIYPCCLVDAGMQGGYLKIKIENLVWWPDLNGKLFWTEPPVAGGCLRWEFENYAQDYIVYPLLNAFAGYSVGSSQRNGQTDQACWSVYIH